jgi:predicted transcriptional regulator
MKFVFVAAICDCQTTLSLEYSTSHCVAPASVHDKSALVVVTELTTILFGVAQVIGVI